METLGYAGVAFLMFLENVFPPIPSELIMPLAGFSAARGEMTLWGVIVAGSVGSVLGQYPLYYLGRAVGPERLHRWADRHGKWLTVSGKDIEKAREWLNRRGPIAVLLCRLVPGVRSLISIPAGMSKMSLWVFTAYSTVGILVWSALLAWLGSLLGDNYEKIEAWLGPIGTWIWVVIGAGLLGWFAWRARGCYRHSREDCPFRSVERGGDARGAEAAG